MNTKNEISLSDEEIELITLFREKKVEENKPKPKLLEAILKEDIYEFDPYFLDRLEYGDSITLKELEKIQVKLQNLAKKAFRKVRKKGEKFFLDCGYWVDEHEEGLCEDSPRNRKKYFEPIKKQFS